MPQQSYVLVVDDDPGIRQVIATALEDEGVRVLTVGNGREALDQVQYAAPALVLLDLQMPVLDGWGFLRELQAAQLDPPVVVMSTGYRAQAEAERLGVAGYLGKPFDLPDLHALVHRFAG